MIKHHQTCFRLLGSVALLLLAVPAASQAIEVTAASLPADTILQIQTGSVSFQVDVRGTTERDPTTYPWLAYVTGTDIYGNTVYLPAGSGSVTVRGQVETFTPASGAAATAVIGGGQVTGFIVTSGGSNYNANPVVTLTGGGGSGATATSFITGGQVSSVVPNNAGSGYTSPPLVQFSGGGGTTTSQTATADRISGRFTVPNDGTLHNITSGYRLIVEIYSPGSAPTDVADLGTNLAVSQQISGKLDIDVLPDLAVGVPGATYQAGRYRGSDIIQFNNTWRNKTTGEGTRQSRPLRSVVQDTYTADLRLSLNAEFGGTYNDDFLLSRLRFAGDTPFVPNGSSILRKITVAGTPAAVPSYGVLNGSTVLTGTERDYTPQPDDGFLDIGEQVTVSLEELIPENYSGAYFVALRTQMLDEAEDASTSNNIFVSNEKNKVEILETDSPTTDPSSVISTDNGTFVKNGDAASDYSSVSEDGDLITFASRARDLLVPPQYAEIFVLSYGADGNMSDPNLYPIANALTAASGVPLAYADVEPYLTTGQQVFVKYRQTRETVLASRNAGGSEANADCFNPSISADGRYVAFDSVATDILPKEATGSRSMIYVYDTQKLSTVIISRNALGGLADGDCFNPYLSQSGRYVAFESKARNLDPARPVAATNPNQQIYLHDRDSDGDGIFDEAGNTKTYLVSINTSGAVANGWCANPVVNLEDSSAQITTNGGMRVAFTSYAANMPGGTGYAMVYRVAVNPASGPIAAQVEAASVNDSGDSPQAVGVDPVGAFIQPFADEATINGDGSQVAFTSAANNLVYNAGNGSYVPTFPNDQPNDPSAPVVATVTPGGDYNRVPDVFVRNFRISVGTPGNGAMVRISESLPRVATGTITFAPSPLAFFTPDPAPGGPGDPPGNIPTAQPAAGESITINDGTSSVTLVFDTDVAIGATVFETRDNLVNAINTSGLNIIAYASNPPSENPPGTGYIASIFLRNLIPSAGEAPNRAIETDSLNLTVTGMAGAGMQGNEDVLFSQGVPFGSAQPSIDRSGRFVAFRSNFYDLDVHTATEENTYPSIPPMPSREPLVATGELIRPLGFPTSNVYLHDRQADSDSGSGLDAPLNTDTERVSVSKFGYKTYIDGSEVSGLDASTSANNSRPAISANGRFVSFSSDSEGEGGLIFGPNNLTPLDNRKARDVFIHDRRVVGPNPPAPTTRPVVELKSPSAGLVVVPGTTIPLSASALAVNGKTIRSVQFFVNGTAVGSALTSEPYGATYKLANPGEYVIRVVAIDSRGITGSDSVTITAGQPDGGSAPLVAVTQPPSQVSNYVVGSDLVFNATVEDLEDVGIGAAATASVNPGGQVTGVAVTAGGSGYSAKTKVWFLGGGGSGAEATVTVDSTGKILSVNVTSPGSGYVTAPKIFFSGIRKLTFSVGGELLEGIPSFDGNWFVPYRPSQTGSYSISAFAEDVDGNFGVSQVGTITFWGIGDTFPTVEIIANSAGLPAVAGGTYPLRAKVTFQPPTYPYDVGNSSVLFYGDGVYLGLGTLQADGTYLLNWQVPQTPRYYAKIYAYLSAPNFLLGDGNNDAGAATTYASVVVRSRNSISLTSVVGSLPAVTITTPKTGTVTPQTTLTVAWTSGDADGSVQTAEVLVNGLTGIDPTGSPMVITRDASNPASNPGSNQFQFFPPSEGVYTFVVRVTDNVGTSTDSTSVVVTVNNNAPNPLPDVFILPDSIAEGQYTLGSELFLNASVRLKGTNTVATNGVSFFSVDGRFNIPAVNSGVPPKPGIFAASAVLNEVGTYRIGATALDSSGNIGRSGTTALQTVLPSRPFPTVDMLDLNPGTVPAAGGFVNLQAQAVFPASATNASALARRVEFYVNGAFVGIATNAPPVSTNAPADGTLYQLSWRIPSAVSALTNSYSVQARAVALDRSVGIEGDNALDYFSSVISDNFTLFTPGSAATPVVSIKSPLPGTAVPVGQPITLQATASIPGSTIARVDYYANGDIVGSSSTAGDSYSVTYTPNSKGEVTLIAVAVSAKGFQGKSSEVKINVPLTGDPAIQFLSPSDGVIFPPGTTFTAAAEATINATTKAPIRDVRFFLNEVQQGVPDTTAPYSQQITLQGVGNYFLKAIVTDIYGSTASAQVVVVCGNPTSGNPPIITMTHPTPGGGGDVINDFSTPSQFYFNALVSLPSGVTVAPDGVKFFANGVPVDGAVRNIGNTYSVFWQPDRNGDYNITAQVKDSRGITGVSEPLFFEIAPVVRPLPSIALLPPPSTTATVGSRLLLQAVTNGSITPVARVDFYANGVLIGSREVNDPADGTDTTTIFEWTPTVAGAYTLTARAIQVLGETGDNSVISNGQDVTVAPSAGSTPIVIISPQPIAETRYVLGSEVFLNATVTPRGGATIPTNGVSFFFGNYGSQQALASGVFSGSQQLYTGRQSLTEVGQSTLFASARDSRNTTGISSVYTVNTTLPLYPLPEVETYPILQEDDDGAYTPDERVQLQARAIFPSTANREARVEFYANGAYLGAGTPGDPASTTGNTDPNIYTFDWVVPRTPGVFAIEARAVALNFETEVENDNLVRNFASVIAPNSKIMDVQAATVYPPNTWNPNDAFVYNIYQAVLYRPPTKIESDIAVAQLAAGTTRSAFVMALMGYDTGSTIFNRLRDYSLTTAMAFSAYARLGLTPTDGIANNYGQQDFISKFIEFTESDDTPVGPIPSVYSSVPDAPWTATKGLARAFQNMVFKSLNFTLSYPGVTAKSNKDFSTWLSQTMFPGRSAGGVDEAQLVNMMNLYSPNQNRQGAAAAFRSAFAAVLLAGGYDASGSALEKTFQRQLASAILEFQLSAQNPDPSKRISWATAWANGQKNPFSPTYVQNLLTTYTGAGIGTTARTYTPASYQGLFGNSVSPTVATGRVARTTAASPAISGEIRVKVSATGAYSGSLTTPTGAVLRYSGALKKDGAISDQWAPGVMVNLNPVDTGEAKYLSGTVARGPAAPEEAVVGQMVYSRTVPFEDAGNYTMSFVIDPTPSGTDRLRGSGFATVKITPAGVASIRGRLADNTPLTASVPVWGATGEPGEHTLLLHRSLNKGAGSLGGAIVRRPEESAVGSGDLLWQVPPSLFGPRRELNLSTSLSPFRTSAFILPDAWPWNAPYLLGWGNGSESRAVSGAAAFIYPVTLLGSSSGFTLKINATSGLVSGGFLDSATGAKYRISGILDQSQGLIDGFFLTPNGSGVLEVNR